MQHLTIFSDFHIPILLSAYLFALVHEIHIKVQTLVIPTH